MEGLGNNAKSHLPIAAFKATEYRVYLPALLVLRIGQRSPEILALHAQHGVECSAILTAFNPNSQIVAAHDNQAAQQRLQQAIAALDYASLAGENIDPVSTWPMEPSYLVLGISQSQAVQLLRQFQQSAAVFVDSSGMPKLLFADASVVE